MDKHAAKFPERHADDRSVRGQSSRFESPSPDGAILARFMDIGGAIGMSGNE
jgi:hypothetical protein